jgi:hypothetical protein
MTLWLSQSTGTEVGGIESPSVTSTFKWAVVAPEELKKVTTLNFEFPSSYLSVVC